MKRVPSAFLFCCLLCFAPLMTASTLIPLELLFGNPERTQARVSPDGGYLSYIAPVDGVLNLWVAPIDEIEAAKPLTRDSGRGISRHFWAPNGTHILYLQDQGGDENWRVYAVEVETGETRDLTPFTGTQARILGGSYRHPDEFLVGLNNRDPQFHDVWRVNVVSGDLTFVKQNDGFRSFTADEDLQIRLASRPLPGGDTEYLKIGPEGEWVPFFTLPNADAFNTSVLGFTGDGEALLLTSSMGRDKSAIVRKDYATGEETVLGASDKADVDEALFAPVTREFLAFSANYLRAEWQAVDPSVEDDFAFLEENVAGEFRILSQTKDNAHWIIYQSQAENPGVYHLYDRAAKNLRHLFVVRPELTNRPLRPMHPVEIEARDGLKLVSYYTLPASADPDDDGQPDKAVPMVLYVHGGPWARDSYGYNTIHQWLANRGFAVLSVNYRGSSGFGKSFIEAATHEFAGAMHDDLIDAVDWAVAEGITARDSVAIMGGSYGGYATLVGMTFTPERFAAGVSIVGPSNLITLIESFPAYWRPFLEATWYSRVGDPADPEDRARLEAQSPLFKVDQIQKPLLIGQGANDPRVVQAESDQIVEVMEEKGLAVTYALFPDEGHGFARPENRLAFYAIAENFLATQLGGEALDFEGLFEGSSLHVPAGAEHIPGLPAALEDFAPAVRQ
ncbi:MAG: S9 family peptidase [Opitutales bacterium]